jgi:short-subunit dehydrogenase
MNRSREGWLCACETLPQELGRGKRSEAGLFRPHPVDLPRRHGRRWSLRYRPGASSGIGATYADRLASRGYDLILVARNEARLKRLSARLASETGRSVKMLPADLANKVELAKVEATLRDDPSITMLVNKAGTASVAPLLDADIEKMGGMIRPQHHRFHALDLCRRSGFRRARRRHDHQHRLGGGHFARDAQRCVWRDQSLRPCAQPFAAARACRQRHRIQAVLPGATATDLWEIAGLHYKHLPAEIVMSANDMVDAALTGLDQDELATIPPLHDGDEWTRFEAARRAISQHFGNSKPAPRYGVSAREHV